MFAAPGNLPTRVAKKPQPERLRRLHFALPINAKVTFSCATLRWYSDLPTVGRSPLFRVAKEWSATGTEFHPAVNHGKQTSLSAGLMHFGSLRVSAASVINCMQQPSYLERNSRSEERRVGKECRS